jgi:hypothetical protein
MNVSRSGFREEWQAEFRARQIKDKRKILWVNPAKREGRRRMKSTKHNILYDGEEGKERVDEQSGI